MSMRQMKAWVLTMEWSTGVNEGTVSLEPIRVLSGVSEAGGALGWGVGVVGVGRWGRSRSGEGTCRERQEGRLWRLER